MQPAHIQDRLVRLQPCDGVMKRLDTRGPTMARENTSITKAACATSTQVAKVLTCSLVHTAMEAELSHRLGVARGARHPGPMRRQPDAIVLFSTDIPDRAVVRDMVDSLTKKGDMDTSGRLATHEHTPFRSFWT